MASTESNITTPTPAPAVNNNYEPVASNKVEVSTVIRIVNLVLWVFTFILLLIALIVLVTNTKDIGFNLLTGEELVFNVQKIYSYRYLLSVIVFGIAYTLWRLGFSTYRIITGSKGYVLLDFYGDKIISYLLATGAAAGFGVTKDMNAYTDQQLGGSEAIDEFCSKGYASASLVLIAFVCTAISSVISSYTLAKPHV